jgi:hypothetical protein
VTVATVSETGESTDKRRVAILVVGSSNAAFYSQVAAISGAIRALSWQRWQPAIYLYVGGPLASDNDRCWTHWRQYLRDVNVAHVSVDSWTRDDNWAQADAALRWAPRDADVLLTLDADTLPVANFEDVLDRVFEQDLVAGVMAHYPPPPGHTPRADWAKAAEGLIHQPLTFAHSYSLEPGEGSSRGAPFYVNGGVVFFARPCFDRFAPLYLELRPRLSGRVSNDAFTGQIASTLAVTEARLKTCTLPMRYNFPNDSLAESLYPEEAARVVIYHYLRTGQFDRHSIFATRQTFEAFLGLQLEGPNLGFQHSVRRIFDSRYPFD